MDHEWRGSDVQLGLPRDIGLGSVLPRSRYLSIGAALGLAGLLGSATMAPAQAEEPVDAADDQFFELVNEARDGQGLSALEDYDPLGDAESGAQDWSQHAMSQWHIWHDFPHIEAGTANAGCEDGNEIVAHQVLTEGELSDEELAETFFEGYQNSPTHWQAIISEDYEFASSRTWSTTAEDADGIPATRYYHTMRFAASCNADNIPEGQTDATTPEPTNEGGVLYSEQDIWEELGLTPPEDAVPPYDAEPVEPPHEDAPEEPSVTVEEDYLVPGQEVTLQLWNYDAGDVGYSNIWIDGDEPFDALTEDSPISTEVTDTHYGEITMQLLPEDDPAWDGVINGSEATANIEWNVNEGYHTNVPKDEGIITLPVVAEEEDLRDFDISISDNTLNAGDSYEVTGEGLADYAGVGASVTAPVHGPDSEWETVTLHDEETGEPLTITPDDDGTFDVSQEILDAEDEVWAGVDEAQIEGYFNWALFDDSGEVVDENYAPVNIVLDDSPIVEPQTPERSGNSLEIPEQEGVTYLIDGEPASGEVSIPTDGLYVTAELDEGYELFDGALAEWDFEFLAGAVDTDVTIDSEPLSPSEDYTVTVDGLESLEGQLVEGAVIMEQEVDDQFPYITDPDNSTTQAEVVDGSVTFEQQVLPAESPNWDEFDDNAVFAWEISEQAGGQEPVEISLEDGAEPAPTEEPPEVPDPDEDPGEGPAPTEEPTTTEPPSDAPAQATLELDTDEASPGDTVTVNGENFAPAETVTLTLNPELDAVEADENGSFTTEVTIPEDVEPSEYALTAHGADSGIEASAQLSIVTAVDSEPAGDAPKGPEEGATENVDAGTEADDGELAATGMDRGLLAVALVALAAVALGGSALLLTSRRRS